MLLQEQQTHEKANDVRGGTKGEPKTVQQSREKQVAKAAAPASQPHNVKLRAGIESAAVPADAIAEVARLVPADEPAQLPPNEELKQIGKRVRRIDGPMKTTGRARYTADVYLTGMLYGAMISATVPHARIRSMDLSKAKAYPGVKAVYVLQHLSDMAEVKDKSKELPSKYPIVRFAGQPIGGIAATTQAAAYEAVKLVQIDYEPLPFVTTDEEARRPDAPLVPRPPREPPADPATLPMARRSRLGGLAQQAPDEPKLLIQPVLPPGLRR